MSVHLHYDESELIRICERWGLSELALFGSVVHGEFRDDSDVDVLVRFHPDAPRIGWELTSLQEDLERLFGRDVDLVEPQTVRNPFRQRAIFEDRFLAYAA